MAIEKVVPVVTVFLTGGATPKVSLTPISGEAVTAALKWAKLQTKPDPADPTKVISRFADSAASTDMDIAKNLLDWLLLSAMKKYSTTFPPAAVVLKQEALRVAQAELDTALAAAENVEA